MARAETSAREVLDFDGVIRLAQSVRAVLLVGVPGVGKSLLLKRLAHAVSARGRRVRALQWDVVRRPFEEADVAGEFAEVDGVTHPTIRVATGIWARRALANAVTAGPASDLVLAELPLVGGRLMEIAYELDDGAETTLAGDQVAAVVPVPSPEVREVIERARARSHCSLDAGEPEDANPQVLSSLWAEVASVAAEFGLRPSGAPRHPSGLTGDAVYDPALYEALYKRLLCHRRHSVLPVTEVWDPANSAAVGDVPITDIVPAVDEAATVLSHVAEHFTQDVIEDRVVRWWRSPTLSEVPE